MLTRTIKQAIRNLSKQKQPVLINIFGLTLALLVLYFINAWIIHELRYDKHNKKADRIYRVSVETGSKENNNYWHFARSWQKWRREMPDFFPEIEEMAELAPMFKAVIKMKDKAFYEKGFAVKPVIFNVFDFDFIHGDPNTALNGKHVVVISENLAGKYFGIKNPVGKTLNLHGDYTDSEQDYTITGVFKNVPHTSHFHTDLLTSYHEPSGLNITEWAYTYILLKEEADIQQVENKLEKFINTHVPGDQRENLKAIHFIPLTDIHLKSNIEREIEPNGDIRNVRLLIVISTGVFIIALVNFLNLLTVSLGKRRLNFSMNRLLGGSDRHNIFQLVTEAGIITLISVIISMFGFKPLLAWLSGTGLLQNVSVDAAMYRHLMVLSAIITVIICITSMLPYFLMKMKNIRNGTYSGTTCFTPGKTNLYNKPLLIIQFTISIVVIIGSLMLNKQNNFIFSKSPGIENENIIMVNRNFWSDEKEMMVLKKKLGSNPDVEEYCATFEPPTHLNKDARQVKSSKIPGGYTDYALSIFVTDHNLFDFFGHRVIAGRTMKPYIKGQKFEEYVVNESAVRKMGFRIPEEVIGMDFMVKPFFDNIIHGGKIVGVVNDFSYTSLYHPVQPTVFFQKPIWQWYFLIKLVPGNFKERISSIQKDWKEIYPDFPFEFEILGDVYKKAYQQDIIINKLLNIFSWICILISAIGLLGITSVLLINKTKEIGIRKVNGAMAMEVIFLTNKDFVAWVVVSVLLAVPVAYYLVSKWLENFAYKTVISWWVFVLAGLMALATAFVTISWQSWRAARRNPVEALRYE